MLSDLLNEFFNTKSMAINYKMESAANSLDASNICKPKDYSSAALSNLKSETIENSKNSNKVKLNFGVDRLLSNNNEESSRIHADKNSVFMNANFNVPNNNHNSDLMSNVNSQIGLNLLQFPLSVANGLYNSTNQNYVLKPFPLRIGGGSQNGKFGVRVLSKIRRILSCLWKIKI